MKVRELHTGQKVSWFETSALEKLLPLQNQLISPWGRSKQRGEKVWDCSRDWFAFVRVVPTRVHICSVPAVLCSPKSSFSFPSFLSSRASFSISSAWFVEVRDLPLIHSWYTVFPHFICCVPLLLAVFNYPSLQALGPACQPLGSGMC